METIARYFSDGGLVMWPILAALGLAATVVAERLYFYLVTCRGDARALVAQVSRALRDGNPDAAIRASVQGRSPLHNLLQVALRSYRDGRATAEIRSAVDEAAIREVPRLTQRLGTLPVLANVATLSGLLGTIFGLQRSFQSLAFVDAAQKASVLAGGISQAMNTTSFGLMVAIPCLLAHAMLSNLQSRRAEDLDAGAVRVLNELEGRMHEGGRVASLHPGHADPADADTAPSVGVMTSAVARS